MSAFGCINESTLINKITIQSVEKNKSSVLLEQSAKIISGRLKSFSPEKFKITVRHGKNQIEVVFTKNLDIKSVENLVLNRSELFFYETCNQKELSLLLNGDNRLFSLLKLDRSETDKAEIGFVATSEVDKIKNYLDSSGFNRQLKFFWRQSPDNSKAYLYALKPGLKRMPC